MTGYITRLIQKLGLKPHPEGGFYKETYRSEETVSVGDGRVRNTGTAIYYMLTDDDTSRFHRILSDEIWFFHSGEALEIVLIADGELETIVLGNKIDAGEIPQAIIPANTWFAAGIRSGKGYSLVGCTVSPGFDFADFELASREKLIDSYPALKNIIEQYTLAEK